MRGINHIVRFRGVLPGALLAAAILVGACDFKLLESPEMPRWGVSITLPLINQNYPFTDVADSITIFEDTTSKELQIEFSDTLQKTTISGSYLYVDLPASAENPDPVNMSVDAPSASDFEPQDTTINVTFALDELLASGPYPGLEFPQGSPFYIDSTTWNNIVVQPPVSPMELDVGPVELVDVNALLPPEGIIREVNFMVLSDSGGINKFVTSVENLGFPTSVDSISIQLSSDPLDITHSRATLNPGETYYDSTDLKSRRMGTELSFGIRMELPKVTTPQVTIASGTDPAIILSLTLGVGGLDSLGVTTADTTLDPGELPSLALPADVMITEGVFKDTTDADLNRILLSGLWSTFPFEMQFQVLFPNFANISTGEKISFGPYTLLPDQAAISETALLNGHKFYNPTDTTQPIDAFVYQVDVRVPEQDVVLSLAGNGSWAFNAGFGMKDFWFESISGIFDITFPTADTQIDNIPKGFTGFEFDRLELKLYLHNTIRLPVFLDLMMLGLTERGDTGYVPILSELNIPDVDGDTAHTLIIMDKVSARTYWYDLFDTVKHVPDTLPSMGQNGMSIVDMLNMGPDTLQVGGSAVVKGEGDIAAGRAVWGEFELIAPFAFIIPHTITFLPVDATPVAPMDSSTREQIQSALLSASLTSIVTSNFPIAGNIDMLVSDSTLFPLAFDELDQLTAGIPETVYTTYDTTIYTSLVDALEADSIMGISHIVYYPESSTAGQATARSGIRATRVEFFASGNDSIPAFWVGRLFDMEIPAAGVEDTWGHVDPDKLGDTTQVIALDAERVNWLTSDKTVYLKPMISFYETDGARTVQSTNSLDFAAYITFEMSSDILIPPTKVDTTQVTAGSIASDSVAVDSTISISLDNVFSHTDGQTKVKDMELDAVSNHTGVAAVDVEPDPLDANKRRLKITGKGVGAAKITVTADNDPQDEADPVAVSFYVTVYQDTSSGPASAPGLNPAQSLLRDGRRESIPRTTTWLPKERR